MTNGPLDTTLKPFPGVDVSQVPDGSDAHALIGSSNGLGVAWMLIQHKSVLGDTRNIGGVKFWDSAEGMKSDFMGLEGIPNVMFSIEDINS